MAEREGAQTLARKRARWGSGGYQKNAGLINQDGRPTRKGWAKLLEKVTQKLAPKPFADPRAPKSTARVEHLGWETRRPLHLERAKARRARKDGSAY